MRIVRLLVLMLAVFGMVGAKPLAAKDEALKVGSTLENLMAAYNGESNAKARYEAFARKADEEGYAKAANLFRAAARSEGIHVENHGRVIREMGGEPKATIEKVEVKSTPENLAAAIKGETYERDKMYPKFMEKAREEKNRAAVRSFNKAMGAEAEHAKLYQEAKDNLDAWKTKGEGFYVCPNCGFTVAAKLNGKCPVCFTPWEKFEKVS